MIIDPFRFGGGGFSPDNIAGLTVWCDVSQLSGYLADDPVQIWTDQSGSGKDLFQSSFSSRPLYKTNTINGHPALSFESSRYYDVPSLAGLSAATMFLVFKHQNVAGGGDTMYEMAGSSTDPKTYLPYSGNGGLYDSAFSSQRRDNFATGAVTTTNWYVYAVAASGSNWQAWVNGVLVYTHGANTLSAPTAGYIGRTGSGGYWGSGAGGHLAEIIIYNSALLADRETVEDYLGAKYGITITH